jgi:hypothetical protein
MATYKEEYNENDFYKKMERIRRVQSHNNKMFLGQVNGIGVFDKNPLPIIPVLPSDMEMDMMERNTGYYEKMTQIANTNYDELELIDPHAPEATIPSTIEALLTEVKKRSNLPGGIGNGGGGGGDGGDNDNDGGGGGGDNGLSGNLNFKNMRNNDISKSISKLLETAFLDLQKKEGLSAEALMSIANGSCDIPSSSSDPSQTDNNLRQRAIPSQSSSISVNITNGDLTDAQVMQLIRDTELRIQEMPSSSSSTDYAGNFMRQVIQKIPPITQQRSSVVQMLKEKYNSLKEQDNQNISAEIAQELAEQQEQLQQQLQEVQMANQQKDEVIANQQDRIEAITRVMQQFQRRAQSGQSSVDMDELKQIMEELESVRIDRLQIVNRLQSLLSQYNELKEQGAEEKGQLQQELEQQQEEVFELNQRLINLSEQLANSERELNSERERGARSNRERGSLIRDIEKMTNELKETQETLTNMTELALNRPTEIQNDVNQIQQLLETGSFVDPITQDIIEDPVILSSGHTIGKASADGIIAKGKAVCPFTRQVLTQFPDGKWYVKNWALSNVMDEIKQRMESSSSSSSSSSSDLPVPPPPPREIDNILQNRIEQERKEREQDNDPDGFSNPFDAIPPDEHAQYIADQDYVLRQRVQHSADYEEALGHLRDRFQFLTNVFRNPNVNMSERMRNSMGEILDGELLSEIRRIQEIVRSQQSGYDVDRDDEPFRARFRRTRQSDYQELLEIARERLAHFQHILEEPAINLSREQRNRIEQILNTTTAQIQRAGELREAERQEAERQEVARQQEAAQQEAARQEAARQEAAQQEYIRQEAEQQQSHARWWGGLQRQNGNEQNGGWWDILSRPFGRSAAHQEIKQDQDEKEIAILDEPNGYDDLPIGINPDSWNRGDEASLPAVRGDQASLPAISDNRQVLPFVPDVEDRDDSKREARSRSPRNRRRNSRSRSPNQHESGSSKIAEELSNLISQFLRLRIAGNQLKEFKKWENRNSLVSEETKTRLISLNKARLIKFLSTYTPREKTNHAGTVMGWGLNSADSTPEKNPNYYSVGDLCIDLERLENGILHVTNLKGKPVARFNSKPISHAFQEAVLKLVHEGKTYGVRGQLSPEEKKIFSALTKKVKLNGGCLPSKKARVSRLELLRGMQQEGNDSDEIKNELKQYKC